MRRPSLPAATLLLVLAASVGADDKTGFVKKTFKNDDGSESPYVVFVPHGYRPDQPAPVILFLHGAGETRGGKKQPVEVGIGPAIRKRQKDFPFLVVIPQSEQRTWRAGSPDAERALKMLDATRKEYPTDPSRVYLTGLSMGGFGTWSLALAHPEKWAAIVPICGGGDPRSADKIKHLPCWCFHGDKDAAVKVELSRNMIEALKKAGGSPRYTEYPGVEHNSWDRAYGTDELYTWLLKQKRKE